MAKQIKFAFDGKDYVLEYTRRTVREMEAEGFNPSEIENKPMTLVPQLIAGAFKRHHPFTKDEVIEKIYENIPRKSEFVSALMDMYAEPLNSLIEEPEDGKGNVNWETTA